MILRFLRLFVAFRDLEFRAASSALDSLEAFKGLEEAVKAKEAMAVAYEESLSARTAELQRENAAKIQLQDRVRDLESDNLQLHTALQSAQAKTIHSVEMVTDFLSQQMFGRNVFGRAPELPEGDQSPEIIPRPGRQAREVVEEETRAFYQDLAAKREN